MSIEEIRTLRNAKPFTPFDLVMADGRSFRIAASWSLAIAPGGRYVGLFHNRASEFLRVDEVREAKLHPQPPHLRSHDS